jgi:hypothetical protein
MFANTTGTSFGGGISSQQVEALYPEEKLLVRNEDIESFAQVSNFLEEDGPREVMDLFRFDGNSSSGDAGSLLTSGSDRLALRQIHFAVARDSPLYKQLIDLGEEANGKSDTITNSNSAQTAGKAEGLTSDSTADSISNLAFSASSNSSNANDPNASTTVNTSNAVNRIHVRSRRGSLFYQSGTRQGYVTLNGTIAVVEDPDLRRKCWSNRFWSCLPSDLRRFATPIVSKDGAEGSNQNNGTPNNPNNGAPNGSAEVTQASDSNNINHNAAESAPGFDPSKPWLSNAYVLLRFYPDEVELKTSSIREQWLDRRLRLRNGNEWVTAH